jgi:hypothetical protein
VKEMLTNIPAKQTFDRYISLQLLVETLAIPILSRKSRTQAEQKKKHGVIRKLFIITYNRLKTLEWNKLHQQVECKVLVGVLMIQIFNKINAK